jgi:hypothetical protein
MIGAEWCMQVHEIACEKEKKMKKKKKKKKTTVDSISLTGGRTGVENRDHMLLL